MQVVSGGLNRMNEVGTNYSLTPSRSTENEREVPQRVTTVTYFNLQ